jgi:hypothetical protein
MDNIQLNRFDEGRTFSLNLTVPVSWKTSRPDFNITQDQILDSIDVTQIEKICKTMMNNPLIDSIFVSNTRLAAVHEFNMGTMTGIWMYRVTIVVDCEVSYISYEMKHRKELQKHVDTLELSVRAAHCLKKIGIEYIHELVTWSPYRLLKTKNFGRKSVNEIIEVLHERGLTLAKNLGDSQ